MESLEDPQPQEGANGEAESGELSRLRAELAGALAEMETMKAVAEVSESTKAEAVAAVQRQCQEEVASLQAILKDSISSYEAQITALKQERQQQQQHCEEKERELGRLKQLLSRAHPLDSLEKQMEKAHEDSEKLREIVLPMEKEIEELKAKLLRAEELIQEIQRRPRHAPSLHDSTELLPLSRDPSPPLEPLEELSGDGGPAAEAFAHNCDDSASISSFSLGGGVGSSSSLPRSRQGLSPEQEETASLVSTGTLVPEGIYLPPPGYQLVPDTQWEQLQMEGRQLQKDLESVSRERDELQEGLRRSNEDCARQMQVLLAQVQNSEQLLQTLQGTVSQAQERVQLQMAELVTTHKCLHHEVKRLNEENQGLRAEQLPSSAPQGLQQEQGEEESLPSSVPELQQLLRHAGRRRGPAAGPGTRGRAPADRDCDAAGGSGGGDGSQGQPGGAAEGAAGGHRGAGGLPVQPEDGDGAGAAGREQGEGKGRETGRRGTLPCPSRPLCLPQARWEEALGQRLGLAKPDRGGWSQGRCRRGYCVGNSRAGATHPPIWPRLSQAELSVVSVPAGPAPRPLRTEGQGAAAAGRAGDQ
uniref:Rab GTPase-binding effector protein 2 n=1 Tax=Macaca fascicularis TaxID=9541 RepID=A0A2K5X743_MACFA